MRRFCSLCLLVFALGACASSNGDAPNKITTKPPPVPEGQWLCYVADRLSWDGGTDWWGAVPMTRLLNEEAPTAPAGSVVTSTVGSNDVLCIKG